MTSVFIGGSRKVSRLNSAIRERIDGIIQCEFTVYIGDANGSDKAIQKYLAQRGYRHVIVFCMEGLSRNNLGDWETKNISTDNRKKDFKYYATKDFEMATQASYGFMIWDGKSKGTLNNILNLLIGDKKILVYYSPEKIFYTLTHPGDLQELLKKCDRDVLKKLETQVPIKQLFTPEQAQLNFS